MPPLVTGPLNALRERAATRREQRMRRRAARMVATGAAIVIRRAIRKARSA